MPMDPNMPMPPMDPNMPMQPMDPNMPMPPMPPMQLHPVNSPQNAQQLPYGFEEHAGQRPPPPPPYVEDNGFEQINLGEVRFDVDGAEIGKAEDVEKAAKAFGLTEEKSAESAREPEPESDSTSRSGDEAVLQSFGKDAAGEESSGSRDGADSGAKARAERRTSEEALELRSSEWRIAKGRKGFVPDKLRTGGEAAETRPAEAEKPATPEKSSPAKEKPAAAEKEKPAPAKAEKSKKAEKKAERDAERAGKKTAAAKAEKSEKAEKKPELKPAPADYPWKRANRQRDAPVQEKEVADTRGNDLTEDFDNLPVLDLLGWLEAHAPKAFLEDQLRQICEEVEVMQS